MLPLPASSPHTAEQVIQKRENDLGLGGERGGGKTLVVMMALRALIKNQRGEWRNYSMRKRRRILKKGGKGGGGNILHMILVIYFEFRFL